MRLIGKCPKCHADDSVVREGEIQQNRDHVVCRECRNRWENWIILCSEERKRGNQLIPCGDIFQTPHGVKLWWPQRDKIPFSRLITSFLNAALLARFNLRVCCACEGGVSGIARKEFKTEYIDLRNDDDQLGLWDAEPRSRRRGTTQAILGWYADLLRILFEEELVLRRRSYGYAPILKLSESDPTHQSDVMFFLGLALYQKTRRKTFVRKVLQTQSRVEANPFSSRLLAGLSDEDIVELFVPPPP